MDNCIFCKIIKGESPSYKIYEDDNVYAFLDIANDYYGHTLVVPKIHYENASSCTLDTLLQLMSAVQIITKHYTKLGFTGYNIITNAGKSSGQEVMHLHFHIIPRTDNDNVTIYKEQEKLNLDLNEICNKLKFTKSI